MLKANLQTSSKELVKLLENIRKANRVPEDWRKSMISCLPKKGDLAKCDNYRGISLLLVPGKVLSRIIIERIRNGVEKKLRDEQSAYRRGRGTAEPLFILRNIIEQANEWQSSLYINFIEFRKAFDGVERVKLWKILEYYDIPSEIVNPIKEIYRNNSSCVIHNGNISDWFQVETGVRQGCVLSGFLFIIAIDWIMRNATANQRDGLRWKFLAMLDDLDYTDDIALLSGAHSQLQNKTNRVHDLAKFIGLHINTK